MVGEGFTRESVADSNDIVGSGWLHVLSRSMMGMTFGQGAGFMNDTSSEMSEDFTEDWFSEESATFGDRLAGARDAAGLGQAELARKLGVRARTLRAWENDLSEPRANRLSMLAGILNVSIVWLLTGEGEGLDAPTGDSPVPADTNQLLVELRHLRMEAKSMADRIGALEKRLRDVLVNE